MHTHLHVLIAGVTMFFALFARAAELDTQREDWHDAARDRVVPVKVYAQRDADALLPIVILSHGLGGSREALAYLAEHWAAHGYFCVVLQHAGSDETLFKGLPLREGMANMQRAMTLEQLRDRCEDVSFAIDELARRNADNESPWFGRLDLDRIAMAGHSFGAVTAQHVCGQSGLLTEPRIKAGIALSPSPPGFGDAARAFDGVRVPMSFWTGTKDDSPMRPEVTPQSRRVPFDAMTRADAYLVVIDGGTHMLFGGAGRWSDPNAQQRADLALIQQGTTAFFDAYVKGDADALRWLATEQAAALGDRGTFEMKRATE